MKQQLNTVLLIDDDEIINFIHEKIIHATGCVQQIVAKQTGKSGLDFLQQMGKNHPNRPELILLDINMPAMNGWEFLTKFQRLPAEEQQGIVIIMLTTSQNPDDEIKARAIPVVSGFLQKPLSTETVYSIVEEHFKTTLHNA